MKPSGTICAIIEVMYRAVAARVFLSLMVLSLFSADRSLAADQTVYTDSLQNNWINYSWATVNFGNTTQHHGGTASISVSSTNWQALYLHRNTPQPGSNFSAINFW